VIACSLVAQRLGPELGSQIVFQVIAVFAALSALISSTLLRQLLAVVLLVHAGLLFRGDPGAPVSTERLEREPHVLQAALLREFEERSAAGTLPEGGLTLQSRDRVPLYPVARPPGNRSSGPTYSLIKSTQRSLERQEGPAQRRSR